MMESSMGDGSFTSHKLQQQLSPRSSVAKRQLLDQHQHQKQEDFSHEKDQFLEKEDKEEDPIELNRNHRKIAYGVAIVMTLVTLFSFPKADDGKSAQYVWWCGWLTAITTGLGALPFYWIHNVNKYWLGICNGLAAGMMLAATGCLFYEGWYIPQHFEYGVSVGYRLLCGALLGVLFIKFTKVYLEDYEDVKVCGLKGLDAQKALLIMAVMTLHSVSEGVSLLYLPLSNIMYA
jgi:cation transport ATPase